MSIVRRAGGVRVVDLAEELQVSEMTVRRDLDTLHDAGLLTKVHGGATVRHQHSADEPGFEAKLERNTSEKQAIAAAAATLVGPGSAIGITAGTTTMQLAGELVSIPGLTVVTNSVRVAGVFHAATRSDRTVVLTGGERTPSDALVGPVATSALQSFHLDLVFMGVHGVDADAGFTTPNLREADTNRVFAGAARELVVVADHTKWGVTGLVTIADLDAASVLVTDDGLEDHALDVLADRVGRLVVTSPVRVSDGRTA